MSVCIDCGGRIGIYNKSGRCRVCHGRSLVHRIPIEERTRRSIASRKEAGTFIITCELCGGPGKAITARRVYCSNRCRNRASNKRRLVQYFKEALAQC